DESITPAPRTDERIEAAIGLARMVAKAEKWPDFQADYAAAMVAYAVQAFGLDANLTYDKTGVKRARPWRVDAPRLSEAGEAMRGEGKNAYINSVIDQCMKNVLTNLDREKARKSETALFFDWLDRTPPASKSLFKGADDTAIKPVSEKEAGGT